MPNTREIRRRIRSIKNTAQITKAMQMVAAAKMRKAQQMALSGRPYAVLMNRMLVQIKQLSDDGSHPLLCEPREHGKELVILLTTDRGLCGPLNTNLMREVSELDPANTEFVVVGKKGRVGLRRLNRRILAEFDLSEPTEFKQTRLIAKMASECYLENKCSKVSVLFPRFRSTLVQEVIVQQMLPIAAIVPPSDDKGASQLEEATKPIEMTGPEFLFEPNARELLPALLSHYINFQLYQMALSFRASEHSARMVAMKSATDNAKELIKSLTLEYNKVRQSSITNEILEISSAQIAMG